MAADFRFYRRMAYLDQGLTRPVSRAIGRLLLPYLGRKRLRHLRHAVQQNLEAVLDHCAASGQEPRDRADVLARRTLSNFGAYIADYFLLPFIHGRSIRHWITASEGESHLQAAVERGRGVLLLTCHLGLWELGAIHLRHRGCDVNVVGLVDTVHTGITEFRDWMRRRQGIGVINRDGVHLAALTIRQLLKQGKIVALLGDRLVGERGSEVEFFGRRVAFPTGPLRLARATGTTVLPCFVVRRGRGYRAVIEPPIDIAAGTAASEQDLHRGAQEIARRFEHQIRQHLDQWYVFFPFWEPAKGFEL